MTSIRSFAVLFLILGGLAVTADAQKRRTTTRRPATPVKTAPKPAVTSQMIIVKQKVSNQLFNVNRFVDVLGPIAQGIESIDADAKSKTVKKSTLDENAANKQKVIIAIRGFKSGLSSLETDFRTKPDLKRFLPTIQGITDLCARSEDSAIAGKFVAAKEPLRSISKKLSDTLAMMP